MIPYLKYGSTEEKIRKLRAENARIEKIIQEGIKAGGLPKAKMNGLTGIIIRNDKLILSLGGTEAFMER